MLAGLLFLASLLNYNQSRNTQSIIFGGLSMLAKETGITIFLVNFFFDLYKSYPRLKK